MAEHRSSTVVLEDLLQLVAEATSAFIGGDLRRYFALVDHADDFTLMGPEGGDTIRGQERSDEHVAEMQRFFKSGEATLEVVQTYASDDLAVLVVVERQHGEIGDYPPQDWSLPGDPRVSS